MAEEDDNRRRQKRKRSNRTPTARLEFINPYPWMSAPEAMVHLELETRDVPFSWRHFDGEAPHLTMLLPDYHPEFTLREYKLVIVVQGNFWGILPGVIDREALASALLEADGWRMVVLTENDIRGDINGTFARQLPELIEPVVKGEHRPNPFGVPAYMEERRIMLRAAAAARRKFALEGGGRDRTADSKRGRRGTGTRKRRVRRRDQPGGGPQGPG